MKGQRVLWFFIFLSFALLAFRLEGEWGGDHDGSGGAAYSGIARNYLRYGFLETKWGLVTNGGLVEPEEFRYSLSHTPLLPLLVALSFKLFGISEPAARLVPMLFAMGFVVMFYLFTSRFFGETVAFLSSFFLMLSPVLMTFGIRMNHEIGALFFATLFFYSYFSWLRSPKRRHSFLILLSFALAGIMSWFGYFVILPVLIHPLLVRVWRRGPLFPKTGSLTLSLILLGAGIFGLHLFHVYSLKGIDGLIQLPGYFFWRTGGIPLREALPGVGWGEFLSLEAYRAFYLLTPPFLFFSILWAARFVKKWKSEILSEADEIIFLLFIFGFVPMFVFRNVFYYHNFFLLYFLPFSSLSAGFVLGERDSIRPCIQRIILAGFVGCSVPTVLLLERWDGDLQLAWEENDRDRSKEIGQWVAQQTGIQEGILSNIDWWPQIDYYSDRNIVHNVDLRPYPYFLLYTKAPFHWELIEDFKEHYVMRAKYSDDFFLYRYETG